MKKYIGIFISVLFVTLLFVLSSRSSVFYSDWIIKPKDYMHIVAYFILTGFLYFINKTKNYNNLLNFILTSLIIVISIGLIDEFLIQDFTVGRSADIWDIYRDVQGCIYFNLLLIIYKMFSNKIRKFKGVEK